MSASPGGLSAQYGTPDKFLTRVETHRLYSEARGTFVEWVVDVLGPARGELILDAGCGPGGYHDELQRRGARVAGIDLFGGMVREATERAGRSGRVLLAAQASVERIPFRDGAFDRVMCNHMLYHVPDQLAALRELQRVVRPGGRIVMATNATDNMAVLDELHRRACADVGLTPLIETEPLRFTFVAESVALVRSVFPEVQIRMRADALVFPDAAAVLRFYGSFGVDQVAAPRPDNYAERLLGRMRDLVAGIIEREGSLRVAKSAGCYVAEIPR